MVKSNHKLLRQAMAATAEQSFRSAFNSAVRDAALLDPQGTVGKTVSLFLEAMQRQLSAKRAYARRTGLLEVPHG